MDIKDKQKLNMIRQQLVLKQSGLWVYTYNDSKLIKLKRAYPNKDYVLQRWEEK